ncbi:MAG: BsaWI family type II restriction enzyme [Prevotellaceae bacterium]|jgi:type II restriction enzyme|nr:BsaWI family type II restriction enzyme [Prevotellaceae bacterium]
MLQLNNEEQKTLESVKATPYMAKTIALVEDFVSRQSSQKAGYLAVFDEVFYILNEVKTTVDSYLAERKAQGEIKDEKQALKSIAGNSFSLILVYIFIKNKELGNIRQNIFVTSQKSKVPSFKEVSIINVDGETQKPDCDLVIYSLNNDNTLKKCMILSLKTSLREREGQTYKWKLLMEIATSDNPIKEKYNITYNPEKMPLVAFATVNFYNEINNPQHRGMFKFFDKSFIAKNIDADFIARMSTLPKYINENL